MNMYSESSDYVAESTREDSDADGLRLTDYLHSGVSNVGSLCLPFTLRRALTWGFYGVLGTSIYFLEEEFDLWSNFKDAINEDIIPVMVLLYGYEPVMIMLHLAFAKYPKPKIEDTSVDYSYEESESDQIDNSALSVDLHPVGIEPVSVMSRLIISILQADQRFSQIFNSLLEVSEPTTPSKNPGLAILIPCHNSANIIERTLESCLKHVAPEQIFVLDNGKAQSPTDDTRCKVHGLHPRINYVYLPETGNKSIALFCGAHWALRRGLKQCLTIDDDVCIPEDFNVDDGLLQPANVKGLVYPILADSLTETRPWVVRQQNLEYQFSDLEMAFMDRTKSVIRPHGACSLWKIETLITVMQAHNAVFKGEDAMMGLILQHLRGEEGQSILRIDMRFPFKTIVPQSYFGKGGNLFQQRVNSWKEAQFTYFWELNLKPFFTVWCRQPLSLLSIKNAQIYNMHAQLMHIMRIPIIVAAIDNPRFWQMLGVSILMQTALALSFNYMKLPEEQRNDLFTPLTYSFYKLIDQTFGTLAFLRAMFIGIPGKKSNPSIQFRIDHDLLPEPEEMLPKTPTNIECEIDRGTISSGFTSSIYTELSSDSVGPGRSRGTFFAVTTKTDNGAGVGSLSPSIV